MAAPLAPLKPAKRTKKLISATGRPEGRPPHRPTETNRRIVLCAIGLGATEEDTAREINIDPKTLRKYYADDIDHAQSRFATKLRIRMGEKALSGDKTMMIFLAKTRLGFTVPYGGSDADNDGDAPAQHFTLTIKGGLPSD